MAKGLTKTEKRKLNNKAKKTAKRFTTGAVVALVICLLLSIGGGVLTNYLLTKNDCFVLNGDKNTEIKIGQSFEYEDEGCKIISYGKNISDKVKVKTNLTKNAEGKYEFDTSIEGEYYIIYTVDDAKFGKIKRVRIFTVVANE